MEIVMYKGYEMNSAVSIGLKKVYLGTNLKNREAPYIVVVLDGSRSFIPEEEEVYHGTDYTVHNTNWMRSRELWNMISKTIFFRMTAGCGGSMFMRCRTSLTER